MRPFRPSTAILLAAGLLATPVAPAPVNPQITVGQQQQDNKSAVSVVQVQAPATAVDRRSWLGFNTRNPVWMGRDKRGKGRKGARSRFDYRR